MSEFETVFEEIKEDTNGFFKPKSVKMEIEKKIEIKEIPDFKIRFRNYSPKDPSLAQYYTKGVTVSSIPKEIAENLKKLATEEPDWSSISLAPKKINWDLKRDILKRAEKLDNRTQRAIIEMMREKLQQSEKNSINPKDDLARGITSRMAKDISEEEN